MSQLWVQANNYARFILILAIVLPIGLVALADKFEKLFPEKKKALSSANE